MKGTITKAFSVFLFLLVCWSGLAQDASGEKSITGTIVDYDGVPLNGVNVIEKGTANGVISDFDGNYEITVASDATLTYSYIGMKTIEKVVGQDVMLNIAMEEDAAALDEVIVSVGYTTQKREAVTGAVTTVKMSEVEDLPVSNLGAALAGRVLGVSINGGDTRPGKSASIVIRNPVSLAKDGGNLNPLYVIDGVLQIDPNTSQNDATLFNSLDASEVESISFVKDGSAAIYGSRASQGVVIVTTKKGQKGPARFSYSGNLSVADETYRTKMMNAYEFGKTINIMNGPNGQGRDYDSADPAPERNYFFNPNELEHFKTLNHDFLEDNWTTAITQRHNMNVSGGSDAGTYFAGISYYTQEGNLGTLNYDRWSFRAGSSLNLAKGLKANFQVSGNFTDQGKTFNKVGGEDEEDDYQELQNRAPFLPMYIDGFPVQLAGAQSSKLLGYHYEELERLQNLATNNGNNLTVNANLEYAIPFIKGLSVKGRYARTETTNRGTQLGFKYPLYEYNGPNDDDDYIYYESGSGIAGENTFSKIKSIKNGDRILIDNLKNQRTQLNFQMAYSRDFGKHSISGLFNVEKSESYYNKDRILKEGVPIWATGQLWEATGSTENTFTFASETADLGYIGRLNYSYDDKYFAEVLYRTDASAKFAPSNYWGNFYSVSGGWIVSKEAFFKSKVVDYLKLRGSVGLVGKDNVKPWSFLQRFGFQDDKGAVFGGNSGVSSGLRASTPANVDLHWSDEIKTNFGVEARLLDNKMSLGIEQFYNMGTDLLLNLNQGVPYTVGGGTTAVNYGEIDSWGTEISLGWQDTIGEDFRYGATFNIGWNNNKVITGDFKDDENRKPWDSQPGESIDKGTWGYDYIGMFKTQGEIDAYLAETGITEILGKSADDLRPGMLYYKDVRGDWDSETQTFGEPNGIVDENDQVQLKKPAKGPQGFSSILKFGYKRFSINTVLSVGWGGYSDVSGTARSRMSRDRIYQNAENRPAFWANMYDPDLNPTGTIPNMAKNNSGINMVTSDFWEVDSFRMSIRNINLSYSLPSDIARKLKLNSFKFNLVAINPFIINNPYKTYGLPPSGDYARFPVLKTYSLGVKVGF